MTTTTSTDVDIFVYPLDRYIAVSMFAFDPQSRIAVELSRARVDSSKRIGYMVQSIASTSERGGVVSSIVVCVPSKYTEHVHLTVQSCRMICERGGIRFHTVPMCSVMYVGGIEGGGERPGNVHFRRLEKAARYYYTTTRFEDDIRMTMFIVPRTYVTIAYLGDEVTMGLTRVREYLESAIRSPYPPLSICMESGSRIFERVADIVYDVIEGCGPAIPVTIRKFGGLDKPIVRMRRDLDDIITVGGDDEIGDDEFSDDDSTDDGTIDEIGDSFLTKL